MGKSTDKINHLFFFEQIRRCYLIYIYMYCTIIEIGHR